MLEIDGSRGEGGGQILRSSLGLSMVTGTPFRIVEIRARRQRPGLRRQHLTAVRAAAQVSGARIDGAALGSTELSFSPQTVVPGSYHFDVGTAGSATLVLQTVLPALLDAPGRFELTLEGGTHNPHAPPFEFLAGTFLPIVERMGPTVVPRLERPGFYPAGGGRLTVTVEPSARLEGVELHERGKILRRRATAIVANLPRHIAEREVRQIGRRAGWDASELRVEVASNARGPGNVVIAELECEQLTEVFTGFGRRGVKAEVVADRVVEAMERYLEAAVPVGEYLADQLLLPLAIAGSGSYTTLPLSQHATSQIDLIRRFLELPITVEPVSEKRCVVRVG
ncbi:MAG: RNA 3'-terminal phosphate cyclase [bacterium]|nr:RNA 3'-terminal phosphate cyclase [bacterium]